MGRRIPYNYVAEGSRLTFVRQTVVSDFNNGIRGKALYRCTCGNTIELNPSNVKNGNTISCGCYHSERTKASNTRHGLRKHPLNYIWKGIKGRCLNPKNPAYKYYGAKGVTICEEWKNNFLSFYNWAIENGWKEGYEIDKDIMPKRLGIPALEYSPEFCTVETPQENSNARIHYNHPLTLNGITRNLAEWARELKISTYVIQGRLKLGWSVEKILMTPVGKSRKNKLTTEVRAKIIHMQGRGMNQTQIARAVGVDPSCISRFLSKKN